MATESTTYDLKITGQDAVASGFEKVAAAAKDSGDKTKTLGDATAATEPHFNKLSSALGMVGGALAQTNPALGAMVSVVGQAASSVTALEGVLGPVGIAIGLAATAFSVYERATTKADDATKSATSSLTEYISKTRDAAEAADQFSRALLGEGSALEQQGRIAELQAKIADASQRASITSFHLSETERLRVLNEELPSLNRQLHEALQQEGDAERHAREFADLESQQRARAAHDSEVNDRFTANARAVAQAQARSRTAGAAAGRAGSRQLASEASARLEGEMNDWAQQEHDAEEAARVMQDKINAVEHAEQEQHQQRVTREKELANLQITQEQRKADAAARAHQQQMAAIAAEMQARQALADAIGTSLNAVGDLAQSLAKNEADGIKVKAGFTGAMEVVEAAVAEAQAISDFASLNFISGAGHQAAAIAHAVAAGKAFAIAGGGGGASVGSGAASAGAVSGAQPRSPDTGAGRSGGGITIQILGPMVATGDKAQLGRLLSDSIRTGVQRYGSHADGLAR